MINTTLMELGLRANGLKDGFGAIADALEMNTTLTTLDLCLNNIGEVQYTYCTHSE